MPNNPFIEVFKQPEILTGFDAARETIVVVVDGRVVGSISPALPGEMEMAYAYEYRGITRAADGVTPIGPAFDPAALRRRMISVMFNGDETMLARARLARMKKIKNT